MTATLRVAIVGASTLIGEAVIAELKARRLPIAQIYALDDQRHVGAPASDGEQDLPVGDIDGFDFSRVDIAFFCGRAALSERYAEAAAAHALVIDGSSAFRTRGEVPLAAADVNPGVLSGVGARGLIALPGSASVALATALAPLHAKAGLLRAEVVTFHAVSGSGRAAMEELAAETVALLSGKQPRGRAFGRQIAFNAIPKVDEIAENGVSREEERLGLELSRLLRLPALSVNATAVRVPVFFGHSLAVHATFEQALSAAQAQGLLREAAGVSLIELEAAEEFPTPATLASAPDKVYVGRIRADKTREKGLNLWVVADNVRKCAAHNAVSVAQILVNRPQ